MDQHPARNPALARTILLQVKALGLVGFLGGLAALAALGWLGPVPDDLETWQFLRQSMRAIFFPCVFCGIVLVFASGIGLWWRDRRRLNRDRWFHVKFLLIAVATPSLHLWARGRVLAFYAAIEEGRSVDLPTLWADVADAYGVAFVVMGVLSVISRFTLPAR